MKKRNPVKVAVVGLGFMGVTHLRAYQKLRNARIVAVCDPTAEYSNGRINGIKGNLGADTGVQLAAGVKCYREFSEVVADGDIDLVDLCTPTRLHAGQITRAMQAHKHVLCEKPLVENLADARKIIFEAGRNGNFLMPAMCMRFWPGWAELKKIISQKTYGAVLTAHFRRVSARPAWGKNGVHAGGALYDLHIHDTDFVNFLFGRPDKVFSTGVTGAGGQIDHVMTQYIYAGGPVVSAEGSWLAAEGFNMNFAVQCERASLDFDLARGAAALHISQRGRTRPVQTIGTDGYDAEIRYFVNCVARGESPALATAQDSLVALEILRAEEKSVRSGRAVKL